MGSGLGREKMELKHTFRSYWPSNKDVCAEMCWWREYPTDIGPVDLLGRDSNDAAVAIEIKRRGEIEVEQFEPLLDYSTGRQSPACVGDIRCPRN